VVSCLVVACLAVVLASIHRVGAGTSPGADRTVAGDLLEAIGERREDIGGGPLVVDMELEELAEAWAREMSQDSDLRHRDDLGQSAWASGARFQVIGENVGVGQDAHELMDAFVASRPHRENLDDPGWRRIGIGAHRDGTGRVWVAVNFSDGV
jgi:uncharacterized protein YkwD